jgi:hypothetical protein
MERDQRRGLLLVGLGLMGAGGYMYLNQPKPPSSLPPGPAPTPAPAYYIAYAADGSQLLRTSSMLDAIARSQQAGCGSYVQIEGGGVIFRAACPAIKPDPIVPKVGPGIIERIVTAANAAARPGPQPGYYLVKNLNGSLRLRTTDLSGAIAAAKASNVAGVTVWLENGGLIYQVAGAIGVRQTYVAPPPRVAPAPLNPTQAAAQARRTTGTQIV